jgi:hypothetical protein
MANPAALLVKAIAMEVPIHQLMNAARRAFVALLFLSNFSTFN